MALDTSAVKDGLTRKIGPLPVFAWAGVVVGGIIAWRVLSGKPAFGTSASSDTVPVGGGAGQPSSGYPTADSTPNIGVGTAGFDPSQGVLQTMPETVGLVGTAPVIASSPLADVIGSMTGAVGSVFRGTPTAPTLTTAPLAQSPVVPSLATAGASAKVSGQQGLDTAEISYIQKATTMPAKTTVTTALSQIKNSPAFATFKTSTAVKIATQPRTVTPLVKPGMAPKAS